MTVINVSRNIYDLYHQWIIFILTKVSERIIFVILKVGDFQLNVLLVDLVNIILVFLVILENIVDAKFYRAFLFPFKSVFFNDFEKTCIKKFDANLVEDRAWPYLFTLYPVHKSFF